MESGAQRTEEEKMKHGPLYPERVLYPVRLPRRHKAISKAVDKVVARMKPRSLCYCAGPKVRKVKLKTKMPESGVGAGTITGRPSTSEI